MDQKLVRCMTSLKDEAEAARMGGASPDINSLISDVTDLCKQGLSDEDVSFAIALLFDKDNGIFSVVELLMNIKERTLVKARESCFTFLSEFIEQIGDRALPHIPFVKEKCLKIFRREDSKAVQAAALSPLLSLLETNVTRKYSSAVDLDWSFGEVLLSEYRKAKTSGTLRSNILILLGYLVEYFPRAVSEENVTSLLKICLDTLEEQLRQTNKDPVFVLVSGVIKCLDSLLSWFDDSLPAGGSVANSRKVYTFLLQVIYYREDTKRYEVVKAGLRLLSRHAGLFSLRLLQDSKEILLWLQTYCSHANALLRDAGFSAFNQFMLQVSKCLIYEESRVQNAPEIYKHFMASFFEILDRQHGDSKLLYLAIRGVGKLSSAIVKFSGEKTLQQVFHRLVPFGSTASNVGEAHEESLGQSVTLIGAFGDVIIHLDGVEDFMVSYIAEVTGNVFYLFPQLFPRQKESIYVSMSSLFKSLFMKGTIFSIFLSNIVWSSLERSMEIAEATVGDTGLPLWPHYVELWSHLLDCFNETNREKGGVAMDETNAETVENRGVEEPDPDLREIQELIFDTIIRCVMKDLTELNLKYRVRTSNTPTSFQDDAEVSLVEPETEVDMIEPLNMLHMRKYLNLVEFIQGLLSHSYAHLFLKWVHPFGCCVMELSNQYPLISGNYKLLTSTIISADAKGFFQSADGNTTLEVDRGGLKIEEDWNCLFENHKSTGKEPPQHGEQRLLCLYLFQRYLQEVLVASRRYKLELLASCLRLCLSAPPALLDIGSLVVPMQNAFRIGLRYPPLAAVAMDALERWHQLYPHQLELWLPEIVPSLSDYLAEVEGTELSDVSPAVGQSLESSRSPQEGASTPNLSRSQLARLKQIRAKANQPGPFEIIQFRVQNFLGQIGRFNHHLVPEVDLLQIAGTGGLAWDSVDRIQFTLPFRDEKHDIWLDPLLSRVVELAVSSSDRRTKVTASELLQALCLVMLGNSAKGPMRRKNEKDLSIHLDKIYRRLLPAILRLAVDVEQVTRQLFNEFVKQLIHWFTSNQQKENPETMALLDAILDGLVDADNGSLREFCAACFGEFLSWSVRHAPAESNNFVNVASMLRRLYNRMDHPNPYKRLGAAMAAHRIYSVLRGNPQIVDRYIFEIIFFCIKSLGLAEFDDSQIGTTKQIKKTLENYLKLVERNIDALQCTRKDRPMFLTLDNFIEWLFDQTWHLHENCRTQCMKMLSFICCIRPDGSLAGWFRSRIEKGNSICDTIRRFELKEKSLREVWSVEGAGHQLAEFSRSVHWFEWTLQYEMMTTEELHVSTPCSVVVKKFLQRVFTGKTSTSQESTMTPREREEYQKVARGAIVRLLNFLKQILDSELGTRKKGVFLSRQINKETINIGVLEKLIPVDDPNFYELMCLALLRPRDLGFVATDHHQAEELARLTLGVIQRLTVVSSDFNLGLTRRLQALFIQNKLNYDLSGINFTFVGGKVGNWDVEDARSLLKGYQQLHLSGALFSVLGKEEANQMGERLMIKVFEIGRECPPILEPIASEMLSLSLALGTSVRRLVELCLDEKILNTSPNTRRLVAGNIFYLNFRKLIVQQVKISSRDCQPLLVNAAVRNPTARLVLNGVLDDYIKSTEQSANILTGNFLRELISHLKCLQPCCRSDAGLSDKQFFLEILHKVLMLDTSHDNLLQQDPPSCQFIQDEFMSCFTGSSDDSGSGSTSGSSQMDAQVILKSQALVLLPWFFKPVFGKDFQCRLCSVLTKLVSDYLLVREADMPGGSNQRASYVQMLSRLLEAVSVSSNVMLLEVVFPLLLEPPKFAVRRLTDALELFSENIGEKRIDCFNLCIRILNDNTKIPQLRRAVIEKVFTPLVNTAPGDVVVNWYSVHIQSFVDCLSKHPIDTDAEREEESLVVKICHYALVELLFVKVEAPLIKEKITPMVSNASLMKLTMSESRAKNDPLRYLYPENSILWRHLHISAYNTLAAITLRTQEQEKVFGLLFKEGATGMIWQHLIDCTKVYDKMPVETNQISAALQTVRGMRDERRRRIRSHGVSGGSLNTLSSQYFAGAGLSQEPTVINTFVSHSKSVQGGNDSPSLGMGSNIGEQETAGNPIDRSPWEESNRVAAEVGDIMLLDQDDFDQHPCMAVLLKLIERLHSTFGSRQHHEMPEWIRALYSTLQSAGTQMNVRLFLTKVVTKTWKVFTPYANRWFVPFIQTILIDPHRSGGMAFHYMLRDICITILQWNLPIPPDPAVATDFVKHLMSVAGSGSSQVLRANVDIIRLFVESWKQHLQLEKKIILNHLLAGGKATSGADRSVRMQRIVGLQLFGAIAASEIPVYDPISDDFLEKDLYNALLQNLNFKAKEIYEASGELLGIILKQRQQTRQDSATAIDEQILEVPLKQCLLKFCRDSNLDCFLNILNKITLRFPLYVEGFASLLLDLLPKLHGIYRIIALDVFLRFPSCLTSSLHMLLPLLGKLLTHRDEIAQIKSLQILMELMKHAPDPKIYERLIPVLCETFSMHENVHCRQQYYDLLMYLHGNRGINPDNLIIRSLLTGLTDSAEVVRLNLQNFWHSRLSQDLRGRFLQMINQMYDPSVEEHWAQFTNVLLLKLCEDSVDYKRPIFNAPLSDCDFHDYTINTAWLGGSLPMTPLFSQSQLVHQTSQESRSQGTLPSQSEVEDNARDPRRGAMIRATYRATLSQTQGPISGFTVGSEASSLFAMSKKSIGTQTQAGTQDVLASAGSLTPLRRRIPQANVARSQILRSVLNANRRREARTIQQATERANKVHMMRNYRTGELPDIEIKYEEVLAPLASLAQKDATFARLLLTVMCRAVYFEPSGQQEDMNSGFKSSLKEGIEKALEKTRNGSSFVGCIEAICLEYPGIWIQPKLVGHASLKSSNFHSGILVLENEILHDTTREKVPSGSTCKRQKGAAGKVTKERENLEEAWLELANLYKELGEEDVVLSLYQKNLTRKPLTHEALEAQLGGDPSRGLILYDQALDALDNDSGSNGGQASQVEQDIWYNQRLECLLNLNHWQLLMEDTLMQVRSEESSEPDLQKLWDSKLEDPYLSLFVRGAVRLSPYRALAADFIQSSLDEPWKRDILMKEYGSQMATLAVVNDEFDRARFYLSHCYKTFRKQWATLHPLAIRARHRQVQKLQKIIELDEFIDLLTSQQISGLPRKLLEWRHRWPSSRLDGVDAWDDIVQNRLVFFHKFQGLINRQTPSGVIQSTSEDAKRSFASKLDKERAHIFHEAARGLTKLGAYNVAQVYMEEYMAAQQGFGKKDGLDYKFFKGLVKLRCLQANRAKLVQAGEAKEMLQQVKSYIKSTAEKPWVDMNPEWYSGLKLLGANVSSQLAYLNLDRMAKSDADPSAMTECFSLFGAAYEAYAEISSNQSLPIVISSSLNSPHQLAKISLTFGLFCDELLKSSKDLKWSDCVRNGIMKGYAKAGLPPASVYPTVIVKHMMQAIILDTSVRAQLGVARVLSLIGQYPETCTIFASQIKQVPIWVFIAWIPQMLAVMDQEESKVLVSVLEGVGRLYPQALYFAFQVSEKDFGPIGHERTRKLATLLKISSLQGMIRALEDLTFPEQRLRDGLGHIKSCLIAGDGRKAKALFTDLWEDCLDVDAMRKASRGAGEYNLKFGLDWSKRVAKALGEDGVKLLKMDEKKFTAAVMDVIANLQKAMQKLQSGMTSLAHLSKWMANFDQAKSAPISMELSRREKSSSPDDLSSPSTEATVEVPGQYSGFSEPDPTLHVKLVGFDQTLYTLSSKQRPKILTMRGSDEKEYKFVVKGGEDLRLDQRIEQLFTVMNSILQRDSVAARCGLTVRTYAVVPVSKSCGLLQFVENTCVLEDVVKDGLMSKIPQLAREGKSAPAEALQKLRGQYNDWVMKKGGPAQTPYECYRNLYLKASYDEVEQKLRSIQSQLPWDTFRAGVSRWATSAESYLALRSQFSKSLSVISICGYVAGVGDRHLANTLVDMRSGSLVPIDFGYSFGTGVLLLPVPELIPFRLTNQLVNFLLPLDALGLLRTDMVHTLSALHARREVISAVMDVFVKEPLVDWKTEAIKTSNLREKKGAVDMESRDGQGDMNLEQQYVELKVENAQRKLELWNPAAITMAELQSSIHANKPYFEALQKIVRGSPDRNARARTGGNICETIREQVDCLIDQATDPNLLGRIWVGWQPWV